MTPFARSVRIWSVSYTHLDVYKRQVQDAILNMNMLGHTFDMFKNEETDKISTVYRRAEDDYGMIEPL